MAKPTLHSLEPLAARNIARQVGYPPARVVHVVASPTKTMFALVVSEALAQRMIVARPETLTPGKRRPAYLGALERGEGLVLLLDPEHADALFSLVGRPDEESGPPAGPPPHLFTDWLLPLAGVVRTWAIDLDETDAFRERLLERLADARDIHVTTPAGTDLRLAPRTWLRWPNPYGEVFTAPVEGSAEGVVVVDGVAYSGRVRRPWTLRVSAGRITNLEDLDPADPQQRMARRDLARDANASRVAELGLGVNPGADRAADIMEAEQARGTCHIGWGRNVAYGGRQESVFHGDYTLLAPTITLDGRPLCREGQYLL
jgi:leucyl aminopeptidase (aminopeptidase T)